MTANSILAQLDEASRDFVFPMLDNGYFYLADVRMTIHRDSTRWLLIIQTLGAASPRSTGCHVFQNCLYVFGNALDRPPGLQTDSDFLHPIASQPDAPLFEDADYDWHLRADAHVVDVRGVRIEFDVAQDSLARRNLSLLDPPLIDPPTVLRSLLPEFRESLLATEAELAARNPHQLPRWQQLEEWYHPDVARGDTPSGCETFRMLAEALEAGDLQAYRPTLPPNTHWRNWPEGGTL